jgi:hypothetical protein
LSDLSIRRDHEKRAAFCTLRGSDNIREAFNELVCLNPKLIICPTGLQKESRVPRISPSFNFMWIFAYANVTRNDDQSGSLAN